MYLVFTLNNWYPHRYAALLKARSQFTLPAGLHSVVELFILIKELVVALIKYSSEIDARPVRVISR